ncbi:MAG: hypothetical protein WBI18_04000, partial [Candidatus Saccharicenans sp.]
MEKVEFKRLNIIFVFLLVCILFGYGFSQEKGVPAETQEMQKAARNYFIREYVIGPRDLLEI